MASSNLLCDPQGASSTHYPQQAGSEVKQSLLEQNLLDKFGKVRGPVLISRSGKVRGEKTPHINKNMNKRKQRGLVSSTGGAGSWARKYVLEYDSTSVIGPTCETTPHTLYIPGPQNWSCHVCGISVEPGNNVCEHCFGSAGTFSVTGFGLLLESEPVYSDNPYTLLYEDPDSGEWSYEDPVHCSLNGNNGEWTNTDDQDRNKGLENDERKRQHKEAHNKQYEHKHGGGNATNAYNRVNNIDPREKSPDEPKYDPYSYKSKLVHVVDPALPPFYVDSDTYYDKPIVPVIAPIFSEYYSKGFGWAIIPDGPIDVKKVNNGYLLPGLHKTTNKAYYKRNGEFKPGMDTILPSSIVEYLRTKLRFLDASESAMKTVLSKSTTIIKFLPQDLILAVMEYFIAQSDSMSVRLQCALTGMSCASRNPYEVLCEDIPEVDESYDVGSAFKTRSVECSIYPQFDVKEGILINGKRYDQQPSVMELHPNHRESKPRWTGTTMCSIEGPTKKFVTYDNNVENQVQALKRLIAKRPDEDKLSANQKHLGQRYYNRRLVKNDPVYNKLMETCTLDGPTLNRDRASDAAREYVAKKLYDVIDLVKPTMLEEIGLRTYGSAAWLYYQMWEAQLTLMNPLGSREMAMQLAHVKREMRKVYVRGVKHHTTDNLLVDRLSACVKRELAKPGKVPRLFVSYGAGCMFAGEVPEFVKMCMTAPITIQEKGETYFIRVFAKPRMKEINEAFQQALKDQMTPGIHHIFIYSDDAVYMGCTKSGKRYAFNVDISSCDSSNGPAIFYITGAALSEFDEERAIGLVEMCRQAIFMTNPDDRESSIKIQIPTPFEGSGTVLTTILNHFASLCIALAYVYQLTHLDDPAQAILLAGPVVGHIITIDDTQGIPEKIQFLKYSPMLAEDNEYYLTRNAGCLLRSFGKIEGDMTAAQVGLPEFAFRETNWTDRMERYCSSVIRSHCHEPQHPILETLRARFNIDVRAQEVQSPSQVETFDLSHVKITKDSFCRRYDLHPSEIDSFCIQLRDLILGRIVVDGAAESIFAVDYSL